MRIVGADLFLQKSSWCFLSPACFPGTSWSCVLPLIVQVIIDLHFDQQVDKTFVLLLNVITVMNYIPPRLLSLARCDKHVFSWIDQLPPQDKTWKHIFPELLRPAFILCCTFHGGASENRPVGLRVCPCPTSGSGRVFYLMGTSDCCRGRACSVRVGFRERVLPPQTRPVQQDCRRSLQDTWNAAEVLGRRVHSYRAARGSEPREPCQRGQEEKTQHNESVCCMLVSQFCVSVYCGM